MSKPQVSGAKSLRSEEANRRNNLCVASVPVKYNPTYEDKKKEFKLFFESKICTQREKDCIKYLWGRKPKPYGFKLLNGISRCITIHLLLKMLT